MVNAHILHKKSSKEKMSEMFYAKVAEGLIASARTDIQEQGQTSNPAGRLRITFNTEFQRHRVG
jgi:hypothetical protein